MMTRASAGGAATAGGMEFQHGVAAWVAAHILAEKDATAPWELPTGTTLQWLRCETGQPVDDLLVGTSANGHVFVQVKRTVQVSKTVNSAFASALDQFVRQYIACRDKSTGTVSWNRVLDPQRDRLVLITSPKSSQPVRVDLPDVLGRLRNLPAGQPFGHAAVNDIQRRVLSSVLGNVRTSWQRALGEGPSDVELRELFSVIRVQILDLAGGATSEREAKTLLRTGVLNEPDDAEVAWAQLVKLCEHLSAQRSGADRLGLQRTLVAAGLGIRAPRSYRNDIQRLREYSATTSESLAHLGQIRVGSSTIKIQRPSTQALKRAAERHSILVVGEPGAGKSGALHDLAEASNDEERDYVCLAVDRIAARSLGELRTEIGLDHDLPEVLDNWPGISHALFVIDALDAARGDPAGTMIQDLIRRLVEKPGRWHLVASIRKFDLRYGVTIKDLFAGSPPTEFTDPEFKSVRHINIPRLRGDELAQIASQSPELHDLIQTAPAELRNLLHVPFNLRLMGELLGTGVTVDELTPIKTGLELLERYWLHRVIRRDGSGDAREAVLREVCQKMVDKRALRVERSAVARAETSASLYDLLSTHVLIEWQPELDAPPDRSILAFSHHVLFDNAVARLLLRGARDQVVRLLVDDPELVVAIRPSLALHFRHLWTVGMTRQEFWDLVMHVIRAEGIPEIGKLIGPSVASGLVENLHDLEPVCDALEGVRAEKQDAAEQALRHLIGAVLASGPHEARIIGPEAGPWCELVKRLSRSLRPSVAYTIRSLLTTMCDRREDFTVQQRADAGEAARQLLEFAWSHTARDTGLVVHALQCVCRTFEGDPDASAALIHRCLEPSHLAQFGFEEMPWLAREVERLIHLDGDLVLEICRAAFSHEESSDESTPFGLSRILPMTSNRRQDYGMALYELARVFPQFLERAPAAATRALILVIEAYVSRRHRFPSAQEREETFEFDGRQVRLRGDYSHIWDVSGTYHQDDPVKMLDAFVQYLETLAGQTETVEKLRRVVEVLVSENRLAVVWRRVLQVAARHPRTLGESILPFGWAIPILTCDETTIPAGEFLRAILPTLGATERERIERAILDIPEMIPVGRRKWAEHARNRLLGCVPEAELVTQDAQRLLKQLIASDAVPSNEPPVRFEGWTSEPYSEEEYLKDQGVPVETDVNRRIRELERPVKEFADKHLNSTAGAEEIAGVLPSLQTLHEALSRADADGVHPKQRDHAWGCLAAACGRIATTEGLSCDERAGSFVKTVLLEASHNPDPVHDPEDDRQFDEHPSWGSPTPRIEAAAGLIIIARNAACATNEVVAALERLASDPVPAVRFQIARLLNAVYRTAPAVLWRTIERTSCEDASRGVLQGLLSGPLSWLAGVHPDRVAALTRTIFDRVREGPGAESVQESCIGIFVDLYIWRGQAQCGEIVLNIAANPAAYPDGAPHLLVRLREPVTHGPTQPADPVRDAVRRRALDVLDRILRSARTELLEVERRHSGVPIGQWPTKDHERAKSLTHLIDQAGSEVYFASGAYQERGQEQGKADQSITRQQAERFYREAGSILDELADVGLPSVTHHLLETFEFFIPTDPRGVFLRIGRIVRAAKAGGYQYESMAAALIVRLVERYLAEFRALLRGDVECQQALIEVLDVFVQAGWPSARRLTYRLEEIFR